MTEPFYFAATRSKVKIFSQDRYLVGFQASWLNGRPVEVVDRVPMFSQEEFGTMLVWIDAPGERVDGRI